MPSRQPRWPSIGLASRSDSISFSSCGAGTFACLASAPISSRVCGMSASTCYVTYTNGIATSDSSTAPDLVYDDGTSCGSTPAGFNAAKKVCNNGWIGLGTLYNPNGDPKGVYAGFGSDLQFLHSGSADQVFLNSLGDFAWTDGQSEEIFVAMLNSSTPSFQTAGLSFEEKFVPADPTPEPA